MELDQALREWVLSEHMRVDIIAIDWCLALTLVDNFLHLFVLLLKSLDVAINHSNTFLIVIDLVVKNLVMSVDRNFTVDQSIDGTSHILEVLSVHLIEL